MGITQNLPQRNRSRARGFPVTCVLCVSGFPRPMGTAPVGPTGRRPVADRVFAGSKVLHPEPGFRAARDPPAHLSLSPARWALRPLSLPAWLTQTTRVASWLLPRGRPWAGLALCPPVWGPAGGTLCCASPGVWLIALSVSSSGSRSLPCLSEPPSRVRLRWSAGGREWRCAPGRVRVPLSLDWTRGVGCRPVAPLTELGAAVLQSVSWHPGGPPRPQAWLTGASAEPAQEGVPG